MSTKPMFDEKAAREIKNLESKYQAALDEIERLKRESEDWKLIAETRASQMITLAKAVDKTNRELWHLKEQDGRPYEEEQ